MPPMKLRQTCLCFGWGLHGLGQMEYLESGRCGIVKLIFIILKLIYSSMNLFILIVEVKNNVNSNIIRSVIKMLQVTAVLPSLSPT